MRMRKTCPGTGKEQEVRGASRDHKRFDDCAFLLSRNDGLSGRTIRQIVSSCTAPRLHSRPVQSGPRNAKLSEIKRQAAPPGLWHCIS